MTSDVESYTYARAADRDLSRLADLIDPPAGRADYNVRALALGLSAITNAVLSLDDAVRSGAIDAGNALTELTDRVSDVADAIDEAHMGRRELRRHRSRLEPWRRHEARQRRRAAAEITREQMADTWQAQANAAYARATRPRWWRPASRADRESHERARVALATLPHDVGDDEFAAACAALSAAESRVPWWQR